MAHRSLAVQPDGRIVLIGQSQTGADVDFLVARSDRSILETRYYKRGAEEPYRILSARREYA